MTESSSTPFLSLHVDVRRVVTTIVTTALLACLTAFFDAQHRELTDLRDTTRREIDQIRSDVHELQRREWGRN